ncbi:18S rRNA pseudouridine methyltransferase [Stylosanthes scabra]|uniref:18S rRNA pseudouridine methyltransferase n=1 Tax=Stylosanthes scabra TaxID=79078 RepID=A0ABU6WL79_9FABA|nr:18S rRNA pseudouridine methyltransferase [Stylosanthes scabra]
MLGEGIGGHSLPSRGQRRRVHQEDEPRVVFFLKNLPFDSEDDFSGTVPNLPFRLENIAATSQRPLELILSCGLHAAGLIRHIYVDFGRRGFYELSSNSEPITGQQAFERLLGELFQTGRIVNPTTNELIWQRFNNFSTILQDLPANTRKIGCMTGDGSQGLMNLQDYITNAPSERIYFFVVGQIANQEEMEEYVDDSVKVSEYDLVAEQCVARVINAMEAKLGIL